MAVVGQIRTPVHQKPCETAGDAHLVLQGSVGNFPLVFQSEEAVQLRLLKAHAIATVPCVVAGVARVVACRGGDRGAGRTPPSAVGRARPSRHCSRRPRCGSLCCRPWTVSSASRTAYCCRENWNALETCSAFWCTPIHRGPVELKHRKKAMTGTIQSLRPCFPADQSMRCFLVKKISTFVGKITAETRMHLCFGTQHEESGTFDSIFKANNICFQHDIVTLWGYWNTEIVHKSYALPVRCPENTK